MKRLLLFSFAVVMLFFSVASAAAPDYLGTWVTVFHVSDDSTTFVMFTIREDHTALYMNQFYYQDHAGMTEKGIWQWEEVSDTVFRILPDDGRKLYFELLDPDHLSGGINTVYIRLTQEE